MTPYGIEPATFRFVAQHLNHCATAVPHASGIVLSVSDRPVCRLRRNWFLLNLHTGRSLTENNIPDAVLIQFDILMMSAELLETCTGL